jgi:type I restriction enzyme, S subunit
LGKVDSPFNKAKYQRLLEGQIEFSVVRFSELDPIKGRLDAEFYKRYLIDLEKKINSVGVVKLKNINAELDCSAFYPSITDHYNFEFEGIPFLRVNDIQKGLVTINSNTSFLPQFVLDNNPSTIAIARPDDIVIAKGGNTLAKLGLVTDEYQYYALSRDLIVLRTKNLKRLNKYFLWAFLHSKYGQDLLWRTASQTGQPHLTLKSIEEIGLPRYSVEFESEFESLYKGSIEAKKCSTEIYNKAEILLLDELGLKDFEPSKEHVNVKNFKESFLTSGRIDAEYYQPKYEQIVKQITTQSYDKLQNLVNIKKSIEPGSAYYSDEGLPFLRVSDFNKFEITDPEKKLSIEFCKENAELIDKLKTKKETILFSKDGSVGIAHLLREDMNMITSGAILHLEIKDTNQLLPEYLTLILNSRLVQMQAERDAGGSIILHWRVNEIEDVVIPIIDLNKQKKIADWVQGSFQLRQQSETLLEVAKRAVEIAIEQDEEVATNYIRSNSIQ